jgi:hypothetical protein
MLRPYFERLHIEPSRIEPRLFEEVVGLWLRDVAQGRIGEEAIVSGASLASDVSRLQDAGDLLLRASQDAFARFSEIRAKLVRSAELLVGRECPQDSRGGRVAFRIRVSRRCHGCGRLPRCGKAQYAEHVLEPEYEGLRLPSFARVWPMFGVELRRPQSRGTVSGCQHSARDTMVFIAGSAITHQ